MLQFSSSQAFPGSVDTSLTPIEHKEHIAVGDIISFAVQMGRRWSNVMAELPIREHILSEAEARRANGVISLAWPAVLTVVQKI